MTQARFVMSLHENRIEPCLRMMITNRETFDNFRSSYDNSVASLNIVLISARVKTKLYMNEIRHSPDSQKMCDTQFYDLIVFGIDLHLTNLWLCGSFTQKFYSQFALIRITRKLEKDRKLCGACCVLMLNVEIHLFLLLPTVFPSHKKLRCEC
jgi:hypothetical protein